MWNDLSMADRAKYIKLAVQNKVTSLSDIIDTYNVYANGGNTENNIPNKTCLHIILNYFCILIKIKINFLIDL